MNARITVLGMLIPSLLAIMSQLAPADEKPRFPDRRELWVPNDKLGAVLQNQKAILLTREQYTTLLRDAGVDRPKIPDAPAGVVLTSARYQARINGKTALIAGELQATVLRDGWNVLQLEFDGARFGTVRCDGEVAFAVDPPGKEESKAVKKSSIVLLIRGKGERKIEVEWMAPLRTAQGLTQLMCELPVGAAGSMTIALPTGVKAQSPRHPVKVESKPDGTLATVALGPNARIVDVGWQHPGEVAAAKVPLSAAADLSYWLDAERLVAQQSFKIEATLGSVPTELEITVPAEMKVLSVLADEMRDWSVEGNQLRVRMQPGDRRNATLAIVTERPSLPASDVATLVLPVLELKGVPRISGEALIQADESVLVREVSNGGHLRRSPDARDRSERGFFQRFTFASQPTGATVRLARMQARFEVDVDLLASFRQEAISLERTLTIREVEGRRFSVRATLPEGEELESVRRVITTPAAAEGQPPVVAESEPDWRIDGGVVTIHWADADRTPRVFRVRTRVEPAQWTQLPVEGVVFPVRDVTIEGAVKVTGYIAVESDAALRIEPQGGETLERRDGRTTPVRGAHAWFRRGAYDLNVRVAKRPAEVISTLLGYALPLEGALDLRATINFQFLHGATRAVRVRVPRAIASNFRFEGSQIAEQVLADDVWTITFQKELTGAYGLKLVAQVPVPKQGKDGAGYSFEVAVPLIQPLDVARANGLWAVEANTETEISFEAKGLNELDALLAPKIPDYQPRHRVIGVFGWLGTDYSLLLRGVRHSPASAINTVVDSMEIDTVVSEGGLHRHKALVQLRTSGAQFVDLSLPSEAVVISLAIDGGAVKPVATALGAVRVPLPGKREVDRPMLLTMIYETQSGELGGSGSLGLLAPALAREIPVLRSAWRLWLPAGYSYSGFDSNLRTPPDEPPRPLLVGVGESAMRLFAGTQAVSKERPTEIPPAAPQTAVMQARAESLNVPDPAKPSVTAQAAEPAQQANTAPDAQLQTRRAGVLPVLVELPRSGHALAFEGLYAPERVTVRYDGWWSRARRLWLWFVVGGLVFLGLARTRPWWRTVWAIWLFTAVPLCGFPAWTAVCNALLGGWLIGLILNRLEARFVFGARKGEVLA